MVSRRSFVRFSSAFASATFPLFAASQRSSPQTPSNTPLPPSIAALQPMTGLVRPFTNEEYEARIEKAKKLMGEHKIDAIVLSGGASSLYFANVQMGGSERLWALVIPARTAPFLVCPAFEEGRARELLENGPFGQNAEIRVWQEDESPYQRLAQGLKDRGISTGQLGIEETIKFVFADGIARAVAPAIRIVSATPITAGCRKIKDAHEMDCLRVASKATLSVYKAVYQALNEGMTLATGEWDFRGTPA
jgi:Xaa-Pro dipeptidase